MSDFAKNGEKWGLACIQNFSTFLHFMCSFLAIFHKKSENLGKKGHFWLFLALFGGFWGFSSSLGGRDRGPSKMVILAKNGGTPPPPPPLPPVFVMFRKHRLRGATGMPDRGVFGQK